jgi:hypothetical protein
MKFQFDSSKPRILPNTFSPSTGWKFWFFGLVRNVSKRHWPFNHRGKILSQTDLIAGIDEGCKADSCSIGYIPMHIGVGTYSDVEAARIGAESERLVSDGDVGVARYVSKERIDSDGSVVGACIVVLKRACPQTGVALRRSNPRLIQREKERKDGEKRRRNIRRTG